MPTINCGSENRPGLLVSKGPTLIVEIGFDPSFRRDGYAQPDIPSVQYEALVDTGSSVTCIDSGIATALNLPVVDRYDVAVPLGRGELNVYSAHVYLPELSATFSGHVLGAHLTAGQQPHFALIGRDFLRQFRMVYDGRTGDVTLSNG